ncbi:MAG: hypothetical protein IPQ07_07830 [Myxococcales bacterium]|nr:hypothetical protein [Myxococcales bacterium]
MTKTELIGLIERQRRFEWDLARDEQTRAAARLIAGKTHDLLNLVQIVKLATAELAKRCDPTGLEFIDDLTRAAIDAEASLKQVMAVARPSHAVTGRVRTGDPVGAAITQIVDELRRAIPIDLHLALAPDTTTALSHDELGHLILGLALEAASAPRIELHVRQRAIADVPWVEILRGADLPPYHDALPFDLRTVEVLVARAGGELSIAERRGGGSELVVALPATFASA